MHDIQHKRPLWIGFIFAPVIPPLLFGVFVLIAMLVSGDANDSYKVAGGILILGSAMVSYPAMFTVVFPYVIMLKGFERLEFFNVVIYCMIVGMVCFIVFMSPSFSMEIIKQEYKRWIFMLLFGALNGIVAGVAFNLFVGIPLRKNTKNKYSGCNS